MENQAPTWGESVETWGCEPGPGKRQLQGRSWKTSISMPGGRWISVRESAQEECVQTGKVKAAAGPEKCCSLIKIYKWKNRRTNRFKKRLERRCKSRSHKNKNFKKRIVGNV